MKKIMADVKKLNSIEDRIAIEMFGCLFKDVPEEDRDLIVFDARDEFAEYEE